MPPSSRAREAGLASGWADVFVAAAGAAGLVFVSLSINLSKIIALPSAAGRPAESLVSLSLLVGIGHAWVLRVEVRR